MALSITSNFTINAAFANSSLKNSQALMGKSIQRISSGIRAPKPADDIVSHIAGTKLNGESKGYEILNNNIQNNAARLNMLDTALADAESTLLDLKAQAIAYQNTSSTDEKNNLSKASKNTITTLKDAIKNLQYKGMNAFGNTSAYKMLAYYNPNGTEALSVDKTYFKYVSEINAVADITGSAALSKINSAIKAIAARRAVLGGNINAFDKLSSFLSNAKTSSEAAYTAATEVDMASEMTSYISNNIRSNAAQAMLAQANQNLAKTLDLLAS